jgi:hypothetical protein
MMGVFRCLPGSGGTQTERCAQCQVERHVSQRAVPVTGRPRRRTALNVLKDHQHRHSPGRRPARGCGRRPGGGRRSANADFRARYPAPGY